MLAIGSTDLSGLDDLRVLITVNLSVGLGHFTWTWVRNWLCRVLGSGQAFLTLVGPRAVTITKGWFRRQAALLMAIRFLLTYLSSVDRAPGDVWPTLLLMMTPVKMVLGPNLKLWALRPNMSILMMLSGSRLGANRTC